MNTTTVSNRTPSYYRARVAAIGEALAYELSLPESREGQMRIAYLRNGHVPDRFLDTKQSIHHATANTYYFLEPGGEVADTIEDFAKRGKDNSAPLTELELHTYDTYFQLHPEKVCGTQQGGSGYRFPVRTIGSRADIEQAIDATLKKSPLQRKPMPSEGGRGMSLTLAKARAKALLIKIKMQSELGKVVKNENGLFTEIDVTLKKEYIPELIGKNAAITTSNMAFEYITKAFKYLNYKEEVIVLLLNLRNNIIGWHNLSKGGVKSSIIDIPQLVGVVGKSNASGVIMAHNHPSGSIVPSQSDLASTQKVKETLKQMDVALLDHVIVAQEVNEKNPETKYYSLAEHDQL